MKRKALCGLRLLLGLLLFVVGSRQPGGFDLVIQQIEFIGARQWLSLLAGSIVSSAPVITPVSRRIVRAFPHGPVPFTGDGIAAGNTA